MFPGSTTPAATHGTCRSEEHTSELQSLPLRDALPIYVCLQQQHLAGHQRIHLQNDVNVGCSLGQLRRLRRMGRADRKSTRLNSSHFPYATLFRSMYAYNNNTLLAISEYTFKMMSTWDVPWVNYAGCDAWDVQIGRAHV